MNRLDTIAVRQRSSRLRDVMFVVCIALTAVVTCKTLGTVANAASPTVLVR